MGREFVGASGELVFVEGNAVERGESAGAEFEFFAYGAADELVFGFLENVADAPEQLGGTPGGNIPAGGFFLAGEGAFYRWVLVELAQCFVRMQGSVGGVEKPGESEREG